MEPTASGLCALHRSLNTPVMALDGFPVGPARAGVALSAGVDGAIRLEIAVRSVRTGRLLLFAADGPIAARDDVRAVEAALCYGEAMGFLFDEDEVVVRGSESAARAALQWRELVGDALEVANSAPHEPQPRPEELRSVPVATGPETMAAEAPPPAHTVLSKFRIALGSVAGASEGDGLDVERVAAAALHAREPETHDGSLSRI